MWYSVFKHIHVNVFSHFQNTVKYFQSMWTGYRLARQDIDLWPWRMWTQLKVTGYGCKIFPLTWIPWVPCKHYVNVVTFKLNCCLRGRRWLLPHYRRCWGGSKDELEQLQFLRKWNDLLVPLCSRQTPVCDAVRHHAAVRSSRAVIVLCWTKTGPNIIILWAKSMKS